MVQALFTGDKSTKKQTTTTTKVFAPYGANFITGLGRVCESTNNKHNKVDLFFVLESDRWYKKRKERRHSIMAQYNSV